MATKRSSRLSIRPDAYHLNLHFSSGEAPRLTKILVRKGGLPFKQIDLRDGGPKLAVNGHGLERLELDWQAGTQGFVLALIAYKTQFIEGQPSFSYQEPPLSSACGVVGTEANWLRKALGDDALRIFKVKRRTLGGLPNRTIGLEIHPELLSSDEIDFVQGDNKEKSLKGPTLVELERKVRSQWEKCSIAAKRLAEEHAFQKEKSDAAGRAAALAGEQQRLGEERSQLEAGINRLKAQSEQLALDRANVYEDALANAEEKGRLRNEGHRLNVEKKFFQIAAQDYADSRATQENRLRLAEKELTKQKASTRTWMALAAVLTALLVAASGLFVSRSFNVNGPQNEAGKSRSSVSAGKDPAGSGRWTRADRTQLYDALSWAVQGPLPPELARSTNAGTFFLEFPPVGSDGPDFGLGFWKRSETGTWESMTFRLLRGGTNQPLFITGGRDAKPSGVIQGPSDEDY